jgi:hypothetical protein
MQSRVWKPGEARVCMQSHRTRRQLAIVEIRRVDRDEVQLGAVELANGNAKVAPLLLILATAPHGSMRAPLHPTQRLVRHDLEATRTGVNVESTKR